MSHSRPPSTVEVQRRNICRLEKYDVCDNLGQQVKSPTSLRGSEIVLEVCNSILGSKIEYGSLTMENSRMHASHLRSAHGGCAGFLLVDCDIIPRILVLFRHRRRAGQSDRHRCNQPFFPLLRATGARLSTNISNPFPTSGRAHWEACGLSNLPVVAERPLV